MILIDYHYITFFQSKTSISHFILPSDSNGYAAEKLKIMHSDSNQISAKPEMGKSGWLRRAPRKKRNTFCSARLWILYAIELDISQ